MHATSNTVVVVTGTVVVVVASTDVVGAGSVVVVIVASSEGESTGVVVSLTPTSVEVDDTCTSPHAASVSSDAPSSAIRRTFTALRLMNGCLRTVHGVTTRNT